MYRVTLCLPSGITAEYTFATLKWAEVCAAECVVAGALSATIELV